MTILEETQKIQDFLEITCSENPVEIKNRISDLNVYMARSGQMWADAKKECSKKVSSEIKEKIIEIAKQNYLSATAQNKLIKSIAEDEQHLVDWLERINRTCVHQIDALRSVLSYEKEQLRLMGTGY